MISIRIAPAFLVASLQFSSAAFAATVSNRDDSDRTVTIIEADARKDHIIKPNAVLEGICKKGCLIRLGDGDEDPYELDGSEVTSIEGGQLYDDELEAPAVADTGDAGQSSQSGSQK